jgi:hypothetical protein
MTAKKTTATARLAELAFFIRHPARSRASEVKCSLLIYAGAGRIG